MLPFQDFRMQSHPEVFFYHSAGCPYLSREFFEGLQEGCPFSGNRRKKTSAWV